MKKNLFYLSIKSFCLIFIFSSAKDKSNYSFDKINPDENILTPKKSGKKIGMISLLQNREKPFGLNLAETNKKNKSSSNFSKNYSENFNNEDSYFDDKSSFDNSSFNEADFDNIDWDELLKGL